MTRILSFWGKGGVGKTTISAATALYLAEKNFKVLLLSSDPTPSLSEVLDFKLSSEPLKVYKELYALELSEEKVIQLWKERFGEEVYKVASSIFPIERDVIDYVAGAPGIADEFLLYYIYETWKSRKYDFIVWDTTAAGGSIRLLRIEKEFYSHLGEAAKMYLRLKGFFEKLKKGEKDPLDLINEWRDLAENVLKMLSSTDHSLILIATPEELSLH
ncbi:MAG TPA: ArsA family ATPase, partial [Thermoproteales archaeon]|nr:ArsA family ATPase [Thermoproteales archaeon]